MKGRGRWSYSLEREIPPNPPPPPPPPKKKKEKSMEKICRIKKHRFGKKKVLVKKLGLEITKPKHLPKTLCF
jgi:hypothetical protein